MFARGGKRILHACLVHHASVSGVWMGRWTHSYKAMNGFVRDGGHVLHACSLYHASEQYYTV